MNFKNLGDSKIFYPYPGNKPAFSTFKFFFMNRVNLINEATRQTLKNGYNNMSYVNIHQSKTNYF